MLITDEDRPTDFRRAPQPMPPMPFSPVSYEAHTAECAEPEYDDPARDGSLEMLGRVLIGAALVIVSIATVLLVVL
jgi:hypothetical protein